MSLSIIKAGICDTLQDDGRKGFQHLGINPCGAMDKVAMQVVNALAGNTANTALLEMCFPAATMLIEAPCLLVIGGADFDPEINGEKIPLLQPVLVNGPGVLQFRRQQQGRWCYLAVHGGFATDPWMNSYATHLKAGVGGWKGRTLQKKDRIPFRLEMDQRDSFPDTPPKVLPWSAVPLPDPASEEEIWITEGREEQMLNEKSRQLLENVSFTLLPASDRMGYNLKGPELTTTVTEQMVSSAAGFGTLQLLPDGQLIVLMADHQTTGGYPRIGHVISAHLSKLAQRRPGEQIIFKKVTQTEAQQLWLQQYRHLKQLEYAGRYKLDTLKLW